MWANTLLLIGSAFITRLKVIPSRWFIPFNQKIGRPEETFPRLRYLLGGLSPIGTVYLGL
uniref:Uncharacterized protein n=1 Tax=Solanum lycopersicum TaxID=4081 RepID=A0A3Q7FTG6_SOLLC